MTGYAQKVESIQRVLFDFRRKGIIDKARLGSLDELIRSSNADQFKILNTPRLSLDEQRSLFGAVRNMYTTAKAMKKKLVTASERHENPTTAELSLETTESLLTLAPYIDEYFARGEMVHIKTVNELSRILYKKAKRSGFSEDTSAQFEALGIGPEELKSFTEKLNQNIEAETDIDEDVGSVNEGSN
jgi:hypothetical protein